MTATDEERLARVTLSRIGEPGELRLAGLVEELGAVTVLRSLRDQTGAGGLGDDLAQRLAEADPDAELERAGQLGIRFVVPADPEWPDALADLGHAPPLHDRGGVPVGLWCKGPLCLAEAVGRSVAVVGSRSATSYGGDVAAEIAAGLAQDGQTVISGAAFGIDHAAHRGALAAGGRTVTVLACGADRVYPAAHRQLLDYIAEVGLVISEAPLGGAPTRIRFLARNRLIAALSQGTVVVEAAIRSGALNTASWAGGLGRVVMGVPGPVTSAPSAGVHQLIRARDAVLVTRAEEVLEAVAPIGTHALFDLREEATLRDRLTVDQRQVLDAVPVANAVPATRIARAAGLRPSKVADALHALHHVGLIEQADGRWRLATEQGST